MIILSLLLLGFLNCSIEVTGNMVHWGIFLDVTHQHVQKNRYPVDVKRQCVQKNMYSLDVKDEYVQNSCYSQMKNISMSKSLEIIKYMIQKVDIPGWKTYACLEQQILLAVKHWMSLEVKHRHVQKNKILKCKTSTCLEKEIIFDVEHQHVHNTDIFRF